jgi:RNA polymerase sigma-70 factor (ECF subfamily)
MNSLCCPSPERTAENNADLSGQYADLVRRVAEYEEAGMADLYSQISEGLRPYLARQLQSQDFDDKIHNIFIDVVVAIQRGQLRDPGRLMAFVRTIARRRVSGYIETAVANRRKRVDIESLFWLSCPDATPESEMISREQSEGVRVTLTQLSQREGEILRRFYMQEQSPQQICMEMGLTHTQYRLLKWRSKARFGQLSRKQTASLNLRTLCPCGAG